MNDCVHGSGLKGEPLRVQKLIVAVGMVRGEKEKPHNMRRPVVSASGWMTVRRQHPGRL